MSIDLTTGYLGLKLRTPLAASSSPYCKDIGNILRLEDAGASAIVMHSLFEEQIQVESGELDRYLAESAESHGEAMSYFPEINPGPEPTSNHLTSPSMSPLGSLNGVHRRLDHTRGSRPAPTPSARIYFMPTDLEMTGAKVEEIPIVSHVASVRIPVTVAGPFFTSRPSGHESAMAPTSVLFNHLPAGFELESLEVVPNLVLSGSHELRLRLHWTALLYNRVRPDLAIAGGIHTAEDVVKGVMAGARSTMMTSALLRHGIKYLEKVEEDLIEWMEVHEYDSIRQMRGSMSSQSVAEPAAFERANYMKVLSSYSLKA